MTTVATSDLPRKHRFQQGLTLIELMVAMVIGLILTAGVIQIFIGSQQTYRFQESLSRVQESGRFGTDRMARDLRMAGYQGCGGLDMPITDYRDNPDNDFFDLFIDGIQGFTAGNQPITDDEITPLAGTEGIMIGLLAPTDIRFTGPDNDPPALDIEDGSRDEFGMCDLIFMEDRGCSFGKTFFAGAAGQAAVINTSGTGQCAPGNVNMNPNQLDDPWPDISGASALRAQLFVYFIGENEDGEPGLYRWESDGQGGGTAIELVEGVEDIHFQYGIDDGGDEGAADRYEGVDSIAADEWLDVVAVRMSLLVRGREDNVTDEPQTLSFPPGQEFTAGDRRLRQVFTTTVALRNRMP